MIEFYQQFLNDLSKCEDGEIPFITKRGDEGVLLFLDSLDERDTFEFFEYTGDDPVRFFTELIINKFISDQEGCVIVFDETTSLLDIAVIDTLYGLLCQYAANSDREDNILPIPELHLIIEGRNGVDIAEMYGLLGNVLLQDGLRIINETLLSISTFVKNTDLTPEQFRPRMFALMPVQNCFVHYVFNGESIPLGSLVSVDDGFIGSRGWERLLLICGSNPKSEFYWKTLDAFRYFVAFVFRILDKDARSVIGKIEQAAGFLYRGV